MATSSSVKLLNTMEFCKKLNFERSSANGNFGEPAFTSANIVAQTMMGPPFSWRWNRYITGFITTAGQQDYTLFNYLASTTVRQGWFTVDDAGNCQRCSTPGTTGASTPTWNHTLSGSTTDGSVVWVNMGFISSEAYGSYSFNWIENSSVQYTFQGNPTWIEMSSKIDLSLDSAQARPRFISAQIDDGNGNITFRLMSVPDQAYPVYLTLQGKPPIFKSVNQYWSPIPDEYSRIYTWGFLSLMFMFADDARFAETNGKFIAAMLSSHEGLTETEINIFLQQWQAVTGQPQTNMIKAQQGRQGAGA